MHDATVRPTQSDNLFTAYVTITQKRLTHQSHIRNTSHIITKLKFCKAAEYR